MRIVRFRTSADSTPTWGALDGERILALSGVPFTGADVAATGDQIATLSEVELLAPVDPAKIICIGLNYLAHVTERDPNRKVPEEPVMFMKPQTALLGHGQPIRIANLDHRTDHEAELALVIGKTARHVSEADALSYVAGYTVANDVSDRDLQKQDGQFIRAKGFDTYCPVGPWVETDLDVSDLPVRSRVNGETRQDQTTASMMWGPAFLVSFISGVMTLHPGDLILTGTPEGVGPLKPGDTIEVEVGGIGVLSNPVV
ncbi:MAG: fumarylacetoacetate hydrolase family protein [Thermomicrobiales bacterium]|nr:fumarylacetoacetate hydrolase family protein [Thermomicrobiales bacterium]